MRKLKFMEIIGLYAFTVFALALLGAFLTDNKELINMLVMTLAGGITAMFALLFKSKEDKDNDKN